jgi:hypothetical protein
LNFSNFVRGLFVSQDIDRFSALDQRLPRYSLDTLDVFKKLKLLLMTFPSASVRRKIGE